jgi:tetratricopeptide (TPR) repeat protein
MNMAVHEEISDLEKYIRYLKERLFFEPDSAIFHYNLGLAYLKKGLREEAASEFQQAIECDPKLAQAYVNLAGIFFQDGKLDQCIAYNEKALEIDPTLPMPYNNLGFVYIQK